METTNAMTVNENGNVDVESLKNSGNMEKQQETQTETLSKNEVLENVIRECRNEIEETNTLSLERFGKLREVAIHYAKKGDLLYPHLKVIYGISGSLDVM